MQIEQTPLPGVLILTPKRFGDARGFFSESWNRKLLAENGIDLDFVQDFDLDFVQNTIYKIHCLIFLGCPHFPTPLSRAA